MMMMEMGIGKLLLGVTTRQQQIAMMNSSQSIHCHRGLGDGLDNDCDGDTNQQNAQNYVVYPIRMVMDMVLRFNAVLVPMYPYRRQ